MDGIRTQIELGRLEETKKRLAEAVRLLRECQPIIDEYCDEGPNGAPYPSTKVIGLRSRLDDFLGDAAS